MKKHTLAAAVMAAAISMSTIAVSAGAEETLGAPENISSSVSRSYITLNWDAVEGADAYRVYMYDAEKDSFVKYKSVSGTKCSVKVEEKGKKYYFKVASLDNSDGAYTRGEVSDTVTVKVAAKKTTLPAAEDLSAKLSKGNVYLSWNEVKGAEGYAVYVASSNGKYELFKTVAGTKCVFDSAEKNTSYSFKVVTLSKSGDKYEKNGESEAITVKTSSSKTTGRNNSAGEGLSDNSTVVTDTKTETTTEKSTVTGWIDEAKPENNNFARYVGTSFGTLIDEYVYDFADSESKYGSDYKKNIAEYIKHLESLGYTVSEREFDKEYAYNIFDSSSSENAVAQLDGDGGDAKIHVYHWDYFDNL
ncbi:MAG: hypothetical protein J6A37_04850 [Oscillospiraceae bacterium]|nr:hypothetical protein [Oscillospiraceae bacterium]